MKVLFVHPSPLMYSEIYLRLEPLGLELVAAAARKAGHDVRLLDLQIFAHDDYRRILADWRPDAVGFSLNYLANIPEVLDLTDETRRLSPECFLFCGGHSASFTAAEILEHSGGAMDCVLRGEGESTTPMLLEAVAARRPLETVPGAVTAKGLGPAPQFVKSLDDLSPARDLTRRRGKYFIGSLDPCASIEFARGCPWDCSFCSAWTFYGRSYRTIDPLKAAADLASIREPGVFLVDDVAFVHPEHGMAIAAEAERLDVRKQYYMETRADVLMRNPEVFRRWKRLGLNYIFLGLEAIDEEGLKAHRKRVNLGKNEEALAFVRTLGISVAVNLIADPSWDARRFEIVREWASSVPEIVHLTVNTPYPGTETWTTDKREFTTRDYRLFDVQHAVVPTKMPLEEFYKQLVATQAVLSRKHLGWSALKGAATVAADRLLHGQTNFVKMLWKFKSVYNPERQMADHARPSRYEMRLPDYGRKTLEYVHAPAAGVSSRSPG
ncbi:MAG TPA: hopanoid C-3 methylase HpnR [Elusimicrobiota bacterium]|nr:hopanoid C-3 methylase HpnR [Elusimicrobiota bacterium]